jgi:hypothetical protein
MRELRSCLRILLCLVMRVSALIGDVLHSRATITVPFHQNALMAVVCQALARRATDDAAAFLILLAERALVAQLHQGLLVGVGVANRAAPVAVLAQVAGRLPRLVAAHVEIFLMPRHLCNEVLRDVNKPVISVRVNFVRNAEIINRMRVEVRNI